MRIHIHLEGTDDPICGMLSEHAPAVDEEITVNVANDDVPPVITSTTYKVEKVKYEATQVLRENVPEIHDTTLYNPEATVIVSVVP